MNDKAKLTYVVYTSDFAQVNNLLGISHIAAITDG